MSAAVYIDGRPAERFEAYREMLRRLGTLPSESNDLIEVWTTLPPHSRCATNCLAQPIS